MVRKVTKDDLVLNTKEGCHLGIIQETVNNGKTERSIIFGSLQRNYDDRNDAVSFKNYLVLDLSTYEVKELKRQGGDFVGVKPENFVIGQQLLYTLGGDKKVTELLGKLGFSFDKNKYREYVNTAKKIREDRERVEKGKKEEVKRFEKEREDRLRKSHGINHPNWDRFKKGMSKVGEGFAIAGACYAIGFAPYLGRRIANASPKMSAVLSLVVTEANFIYLGIFNVLEKHTGLKPHMFDPFWMAAHNPGFLAVETLIVTPGASATAYGIYKLSVAINKSYSEWKRKEDERRRLETVRQAFCPADSETYYQV